MLENVSSHCPYCGKDIAFTAQVAATAAGLKSKGDQAAELHDYEAALSAYRSALRFQDTSELKSMINEVQKSIKRRLMRRTILLGGFVVLWGIGVGILWIFSTRTLDPAVPSNAFENTPAGLTVHLAREAFAKQDWDLALASLTKLSKKSADWNWVVQSRMSEAADRYVREKLGKAFAAKAAGDLVLYRQILTELGNKRLDSPDQAVFRLRRAEGVALFERLNSLSPDERGKTLGIILSLFRPDELSRIYYADDCLYQLGLIKEQAGDEKAAADCFRLLLDRCPQGKWYWPAARNHLNKLHIN